MKGCRIWILLVLLFLPQWVFAQQQAVTSPEKGKVVSYVYSLNDREKLFGNKSQEEIDAILEKEAQRLMEGPYGNASFSSKDGLIATSSITPPQQNRVDMLNTLLYRLYSPAMFFFYFDE